jgi:putative ABC transport system substrate-binding protein
MRFDRLKRREFFSLIGGAAAAWPLAARAQQAERLRRIDLLMAAFAQADREGQTRTGAFLDTMQRLGWIDGRNLRIGYHWGAGKADPTSSAQLVRSVPDVMVAMGNPVTAKLQRLTNLIPIVFTEVGDALGSGIVTSLARPGGNITGFELTQPSMGGKWLGVLKEATPNMSRVAIVFGSDAAANRALLRAAEAVAPSLGVEVTAIDIREVEIESAIATFASSGDGGLMVIPHPRTVASRGSITILAARYRLPAVYPLRSFVIEGGLIFYGADPIEQWRGAATYVDRILRGEKPGDLPVQAPSKFELVVNMRTAKALGLNIPPTFPLRADEVIE